MGPEIFAGILITLSFFALVFGIFYIRNRENMALIEKGFNPRQSKAVPKPFISLKYGLLLCGFGVGLLLALLVDTQLMNHKVYTSGGDFYYRKFPEVYFACIAMFGGLGLILSYRIEKKEWFDKTKD